MTFRNASFEGGEVTFRVNNCLAATPEAWRLITRKLPPKRKAGAAVQARSGHLCRY
jgi:hypothetical protein